MSENQRCVAVVGGGAQCELPRDHEGHHRVALHLEAAGKRAPADLVGDRGAADKAALSEGTLAEAVRLGAKAIDGGAHPYGHEYNRYYGPEQLASFAIRAALPVLLGELVPREEAVLRWTCQTCGWEQDCPMPGFPGSSNGMHYHGSPDHGCGPLVAHHAGYRAHPGASAVEMERLAAEARPSQPPETTTKPEGEAPLNRSPAFDRLRGRTDG